MAATQVRELSVEVAQQQLSLEEMVTDLERRTRQRQNEGQRRLAREELLRTVVPESWEQLDFSVRQQYIQQVLQRVVTFDDSLQIVLRSV